MIQKSHCWRIQSYRYFLFQLCHPIVFLFFFAFIAALLWLLEIPQVLTLLEGSSCSQRHLPRILVSLVLKGLRRNLTTKLGHLLKQRSIIFISDPKVVNCFHFLCLETPLTQILWTGYWYQTTRTSTEIWCQSSWKNSYYRGRNQTLLEISYAILANH